MLCGALSEKVYLVQFECDALELRVVAEQQGHTVWNSFVSVYSRLSTKRKIYISKGGGITFRIKSEYFPYISLN